MHPCFPLHSTQRSCSLHGAFQPPLLVVRNRIWMHAKNWSFTNLHIFRSSSHFQHISYLYIYVSIECFLILFSPPPALSSYNEPWCELKAHNSAELSRVDGSERQKASWKTGNMKKLSMLKRRIIIIFMYEFKQRKRIMSHEARGYIIFSYDITNALSSLTWMEIKLEKPSRKWKLTRTWK